MTPWLCLHNIVSSLKSKVSTGTLSARDVIMITVCLLVGLQALPCQSTGKTNHKRRALWVQAIFKLLRHKINLLQESDRSHALQYFAVI